MTDFLTDEEMAQQEQGLDFLSDDDMAFQEQLEKEQAKVAKLKEETAPNIVQSVAGGIAQGVTLGFADEIEAGIESALTEKTYDQVLDETRQRYKEEQAANPVAFGVGEFGASVLPGGAIAKGVGGAIAGGAAIGGIQAAGTSEESITESPSEFATDVAVGAGLGAVVGKVGEVVGKGVGAIKKGVKVPEAVKEQFDPAKLRESALHKTPGMVEKEILNPKIAKRLEDSISEAESLGLYKPTIKGTFDSVQAKVKEVGQELGDMAKGLPKLFKEDLNLTKNVLDTIDKGKDRVKATILKDLDEAILSPSEARKTKKIVDETFSGLQEKIDRTGNGLESLRELRIGLSKRLKGADYITGPKAGTHKDAVKRVIDSIRDLETKVVGVYKKHTKDEDVLERLAQYDSNMARYSKLKTLEEALAKTEAKSSKLFGIEELVAGGLSPELAIGQLIKRHTFSSTGKMARAKAIESLGKGKIKVSEWAKKLGISTPNASKYLKNKGIKIENGVISISAVNQLRKELKKEEDK